VRRITGVWVVLAWLITIAFGYFGVSPLLDWRTEGIAPALIPKLPLVVTGLALLASLGLTFAWARGPAKPANLSSAAASPERRRFLAGAAVALGGVIGTAGAVMSRYVPWYTVTRPALGGRVARTDPDPRPAWRESRIRAYRPLGRTGFEVSDISLGSGRIHGEREDIARAAIDRGVNYFDTAPDYAGSKSEQALGRAMQGRREQMFVATKFCTPQGHLPAGSSTDQYVAAVEGSLKRLQTDYVDLVHVHSCNQVARLQDPNLHEAFARLKEQGKARFLGFSSHTPDLETVAAAAIEDGRFDAMMLAYHHGAWPQLHDLIDRAAARGMGVVAMKTLQGARHRGLVEMRDEADAYSQAAFKWVLSNPSVSCLVISFFEPQHVDEYLHASGQPFTGRDQAILEKYQRLIAGTYCAPHCGGPCLKTCPVSLPIHDVLRYRMYFEDYGDEKNAMQLYAALEAKGDVCASCSAPCAGSCPLGIDVRERVLGAHERLILAG
jgi:aryl-alcohol dehydrogenase-like predicted oxidoreductase